jgi:hypothetical protein
MLKTRASLIAQLISGKTQIGLVHIVAVTCLIRIDELEIWDKTRQSPDTAGFFRADGGHIP